MSKTKKIILIISLLLVMIVATITTIILVNRNDNPPVDNQDPIDDIKPQEKQSLSVPKGLKLDGTVLSWHEVDNALSYIVYVGLNEYVVTTNSYDLSNLAVEGDYFSVVAVSDGSFTNSPKSIERCYITIIDEEEVLQIKNELINELGPVGDSLDSMLDDIALEFYKEGLTSEEIKKVLVDLNNLKFNLESLTASNVSTVMNDVLGVVVGLTKLDLTDYSVGLLIKNLSILNLETSQLNVIGPSVEMSESISVKQNLSHSLQKLADYDVERIALVIRYFRVLNDVLNDQLPKMFEKFAEVIQSEMDSENSGIELIYDIVTMKDQIVYSLMRALPEFNDYDYVIKLVNNIYLETMPESLDDASPIDAFLDEFYNLYLENHRIISFVKFLDGDDVKEINENIIGLYDSVGGDEFVKNIDRLYEYYEQGLYEFLLMEILELGFTENGVFDVASYNKLRNGIVNLVSDLSSENYTYLEEAIMPIVLAILNDLKNEHYLGILAYPIYDVINNDANFSEAFVKQFDLSNYFTLCEGKTTEDLLTAISSITNEQLENLDYLHYNPESINQALETLGLDEIIVVDADKMVDVFNFNLIYHLRELTAELNSVQSRDEMISLLFKHYKVEENLIPYFEQMLVELDERYGLNIDYGKFIINLLTNLGVDFTSLMINLQIFYDYTLDLRVDFEIEYQEPPIIKVEKDNNKIQNCIEKNFIYFVFGEEYLEIYESSSQLLDEMNALYHDIIGLMPSSDEISEIVTKYQTIFGDSLNVLNIIERILENEMVDDRSLLDELRELIQNDFKNYKDDVIIILQTIDANDKALVDAVIDICELFGINIDQENIKNLVSDLINNLSSMTEAELESFIDEFFNQLENELPTLNIIYNDLEKYLNELEVVEVLFNQELETLFNEEYINNIETIIGITDLNEFLTKYNNDQTYKEKVDNLIGNVVIDVMTIVDSTMSTFKYSNEEIISTLGLLDTYLVDYNFSMKEQYEMVLNEYNILKTNNYQKLIDYIINILTQQVDEPNKNETLEKQLYCQYDSSISFEKAQGGLRLFIPTTKGYINYNIVHSVSESINADIWRIGQAYAFDDNLENEYAITPSGAEWDMALKLSGRDDFIGGSAHGDERYTSLTMFIDGKQVEITSIKDLTSFTEITILENSIGYDPNDHTTQVLKHYKEYIINANGITLNQKVEWLNDYTLGSSYMAMMPPLKTLTDTFYTNIDYNPMPTLDNYGYYLGATKAVVYGSNLSFSMSIPKYPSLTGGDRFLLTDNGGGTYNKMYFVICNGASVSSGDIWETTTCYQITNS